MKKDKTGFGLAVLSAYALGLALWSSAYALSPRSTILDHGFRPDPVFFLLSLAASYLVLVLIWIRLSRVESRSGIPDFPSRLRNNLLALSPLALLLATPLLFAHYLTRDDLRIRLNILLAAVAVAVFAIKAATASGPSGGPRRLPGRLLASFESLPPRKKMTALFLAAFAAYNLAAFILVSRGITFSGDEPNYLLTAHSLLYDRDINLANNYAQQDYFHFYSKEDNPRLKLGIYGRHGRRGPQDIYPINLPGTSVLTLPFYWLSQFFRGRILTFLIKGSLAVWAALLGVQVYLLAGERFNKERLSLALWAVFGFSAPVLFYATHIYPEIPVAFFSLLVYRKMTSPAPLRAWQTAGLGLALSTFMWFGVKFNMIFWPLLAVSVYCLLRQHKAGWKVACFLAFPLLSTALFYYFVYSLYGTISPFSIYEGVMTPEQAEALKRAILEIPFLQRIDTFFDYFLDQRDGLLLYSPVYLFALMGMVELYRRSRREFFFLALIAMPFILNYAFFTHRQGYSPQGRVLMPLAWAAAVGLAYFLAHNRSWMFSSLFKFAALAAFAAAAVLLRHPSFLYQPTTHEYTERAGDLFVYLSNLRFFLPRLLPSFIKIDNTGYWPNYVWVPAVVAIIVAYARSKAEPGGRPLLRVAAVYALLAAAFFLWVLHPRSVLHPVRTSSYSQQKALGFHTFPMGKGVVLKQNGELYLHLEKRYRILFSSRRELDNLKLTFGSDAGDYEIRADFFDLPLFEEKTSRQMKEFFFAASASRKVKNLFLYEIDITLKHLSPESMLVEPFFFSIVPQR